ncbi:MAG: outer membrane beta-barrel protein [Gammaproteobacteria bacterium]|nr:outer membrane beta-barrel protein [Gammaproteobacteria bacterium]
MLSILPLSFYVDAAELDYLVGYQALYSDNIRQSATNAESDLIHRLYSGFVYHVDEPAIQSSTTGTIKYDDYKNNTYNGGFNGTLDSLNTIIMVPRFLRWAVDDHLHYLPINSTTVFTPDNSQQTNLFSSGPTFGFNFTPIDKLELEGRYEKYYEEKTSGDNTRNYYAARINHEFSATNSLELNHEIRRYKFDDQINYVNYNRNDTFLRYASRGSTNDYFVELGNTTYKKDNNTTGSGNRGRLGLFRRITRDSSFAFNYRNELSDVPQELGTRSWVDTIVINGIAVSNTADIFRIISAEAIYNNIFGRDDFVFNAFHNETNYQSSAVLNDEKETGASIKFTHELTTVHRVLFLGLYSKQHYPNQLRDDLTASANVSYEYSYTRNIILSISLGRLHRNSTNSNDDYSETKAAAGIRYQTRDLSL